MKKTAFQHLIIIAVGSLFYLLDVKLNINKSLHQSFVLAFTTAKTIYFMSYSFQKIKELSDSEDGFGYFLRIILLHISVIVFSFGIDFFVIQNITEYSFAGFTELPDTVYLLGECLYLSISVFSTAGFGDIHAVSLSAKYLVSLEMIVAFVTTVFIISNFIHLKAASKKE